MINLNKVKLIIWDLDETLWQGTISEGKIEIDDEIVNFIKNTLDMGIVHSICSKNDYDVIKKKLEEENLWEYFVFVSADWSSKGSRIKGVIENMGLRNVNTLFVDDNIQNLNEAKFFCDGIMTALPEELKEAFSLAQNAEKKDKAHKRLNQYKILEEKNSQKKSYSSNEEFLMSCDIKVDISENCMDQIERIEELVLRSNQLNYTKVRSNKDELINLISEKDVKCGFVSVKDKFGDYGVVGFYAIKEDELKHFVFSCRTLGMQIEQFVYKKLNCPKLKVVGEVVTILNDTFLPPWINIKEADGKKEKARSNSRVLFKGPCDMSQIFSFIEKNGNIETEFTYVGENGVSIEGYNHTAQIVTALCNDEKTKKEITDEFSWFDKDMLRTKLSENEFDFVVLSLLNDGNLGVYKNKETGNMVAFCKAYYDVTDEKNWGKYINEEIFTSNIKFKKEELQRFSQKYEFIDNKNANVTIDSLEKIYNRINGKLILLLPCERPFENLSDESYNGRHITHKILNEKVREWAENKENVILMQFDQYVHSQRDYTDTINHFTKKVYYDLSQDLINTLNTSGTSFKRKSKLFMRKASFIQFLRYKKKYFVEWYKKLTNN